MAEQLALGFGGLLRQLRAEAGLTQEELAEAASLSPRSVSDLERGVNRTARKDTAELLAGALGLAEPARALFVAAARGRIPAADVLPALHEAAPSEDPAPGLAASRGPYLGLVPFEERDARLFYGRDELADRLVRRLAERLDGTGILLVTGESGSGKSSLLRAGLMPRLAAGRLGPGSERWPRRVIRPTASPLRELAMHLAEMAGVDPVSVYRSLAAAPYEAPMLAGQAARGAAGRGADARPDRAAGHAATAPPRLVLVVDQFEELFTAGQGDDVDEEERKAFTAALHAAATFPAGPHGHPPALVVAVVRADYLGRLIGYPPLKAALDAGLFTVGPMSEAELRLAVTGPAAEAGLVVEPAVVEAVTGELRDGAGGGLGSGVLPLMSQAMAATWEHREGNELTLRGYRRAGGVADAVNRGAQAAYDALTGPQQDAARLLFTQLTVIMASGQFARRRCRRADLSTPGTQMAADVDAVIGVFSAQRLLVLGEGSVEIAHDALLDAWKQLRDWLGDDQLDRALYSQVVTDAATWESSGRDSAYVYRPGRLAAIDAASARWQGAPTRYPPLPAISEAFLRAAHHAARRATRRRRGVIAGLLALTVIAVSAAGVAVRDAASASRQHAIALSRELATESLAVDSGHPLTARRLAVAAWSIYPTDQAGSALASLLTEQQQRGIIPGDSADFGAIQVAFSPDGKLLAAAYGDGYVRLWNPATGQASGAPIPADTGAGGGVFGVAFSPDGTLLATGGAHGIVRLWDPVTGQAIGAPIPADTGPVGGVIGMTFSPDGTLLATGGVDRTVRLWNPVTHRAVGAPVAASTSPDGGVNAVAFSPDGRLLATADTAGYVTAMEPRHPAGRRRTLPRRRQRRRAGDGVQPGRQAAGHRRHVRVRPAMEPRHPAGRRRAAPGRRQRRPERRRVQPRRQAPSQRPAADGILRLWNPHTGQSVGAPLPAAASGGLNAVAFSPDGTLLATGDGDGSVRLWNPATRQPPRAPFPAVTGGANAVAFSPDGTLLAVAGGDGTVPLWDPATRQPAGVLAAETGPDSRVNAVAFSPDGKLLASVNGDATIGLWILGTRHPSGGFSGRNAVAFSPDGKLLASAEEDGTVRRWDLGTRQPAGAPLPADPGSTVLGVAFSRDGKLLASAGGDGYVRLWNPVTGHAAGAPPPGLHRPGSRREGGGVRPRRHAAGQRRWRRHRPAVEPAHRAGRGLYSGRVAPARPGA